MKPKTTSSATTATQRSQKLAAALKRNMARRKQAPQRKAKAKSEAR